MNVPSNGTIHQAGEWVPLASLTVTVFHLRRWIRVLGAKDESEVRRLSKGATLDGPAKVEF